MWLLIVFSLYAVLLSVLLARAGHRAQPSAASGGEAAAPERLLIVGATGGTGRQLVVQALERGYRVTALARRPADLELEHPRLSVVRGDVLDAASLAAATEGQDAVLCALGHRRFLYPTRILSRGTANLLEAMATHGVRRLVVETALGIGSSAGRMGLYYTLFTIPVVLPWYFADKARQEQVVAASDADWVIVRPGVLTHGQRRGGCRHGLAVGSYLWTVRISRADVAAFMLDQLTSNAYLRTAPGVCNR